MYMYDTIIIGGGIAGLYAAYKLIKKTPTIKILILERNRKGYLGGRAGNAEFGGTTVVTGAGVGRKKKDKLLIKLLKELEIEFGEFETKPAYSNALVPCNVKETFLHLKSQYEEAKHSHLTFKQFATSILTKEQYHHFIMCAGYTDYEKEAANDTLYHYGFEDNYTKWTGLSISWSTLVDELAKKIGHKNIKMSQNVLEIEEKTDKPSPSSPSFFLIKTKTDQFETQKIIIATTIHSVKTLLKPLITKKQEKLYDQIHSQPFLRVYGRFSKESIPLLKMAVPHLIIVPGPLHKIITIDSEKGIYMIAYTDNLPAEMLHEHSKNNKTNRDFFARLVEKSLGLPQTVLTIEEMAEWYWETGTHYYEPLKGYETRERFIKDGQHPHPNIMVVGEMISQNQGWVQGALESVEAVL